MFKWQHHAQPAAEVSLVVPQQQQQQQRPHDQQQQQQHQDVVSLEYMELEEFLLDQNNAVHVQQLPQQLQQQPQKFIQIPQEIKGKLALVYEN